MMLKSRIVASICRQANYTDQSFHQISQVTDIGVTSGEEKLTKTIVLGI